MYDDGPLLVDLLATHAARTPEAPCLAFEDQRYSFRDLDERSSRVANALRGSGVVPGDRVAILTHMSPVSYELAFGCAKAGAIMLPINWRLAPGEVAQILADGDPALVLASAALAPSLIGSGHEPTAMDLETGYPAWRDAAPIGGPRHMVDPGDPVLLLYTSGTTGKPKGVVLTHRNVSYTAHMARECWGFTADSVNLVAMPLFHIGGIGYGMMALAQGGHTVLLSQPAPSAVLNAIRRHRVSHAFFVPTVIQMLVDAPEANMTDLSSLKRIMYGASPISETLLKRAIDVFGCDFSHAYGMTETAGTVITLAPEDHDLSGERVRLLRACGKPVPWAEIAIVEPATDSVASPGEVGEIRVRSGMVMQGYWRNAQETAAALTLDGWLRTGDAAYQDADGYVYIQDRYKDMIVSGGENIYPAELENVLGAHPAVAEIAVIGVPHSRWGETPKAFVILKAGMSLAESDLISFARSHLARYKCPTSVEFLATLPRSASGKILKHEIRALEAAQDGTAPSS